MMERVGGGVCLSSGYHSSVTGHHYPSLALQTEAHMTQHSLRVVTGTLQQALQIFVRVEIDWPVIQEI